MKIGALEIYWHPGPLLIREAVRHHLRYDAMAREIAAGIVRSEVKNYMAELSEAAGVPFRSPLQFVQNAEEAANNAKDRD